ncbi:hypothetical protein ACHHZA_17365 [Citrobacter freundii complex sp. 2024EL-00230]|uniref:hypothetical protein n=1 Tax=Citrobacter freundii complex sp. 2024EL-00230 TaxID=3374265 RepID=UPI00375335CE
MADKFPPAKGPKVPPMQPRIKSISANRCGKCGDALPVESCPCDGDSQCWVTRGWHETKLAL